MTTLQTLYNDIFRDHARISARLIGSGEKRLARVLAMLERETSALSGEDLTRYGHVIGDNIHYLGAVTASITSSLHRLFVREQLIRSIPEDCDQIIELGGGWGPNLFHLWLWGGPRNAEYVSLELSDVGRGLSEMLSRLAPEMRFRSGHADLLRIDLSGVATGRKVHVLSCYSLALVRELSDDFFSRVLASPGICGGVHVEPGAWQVRPASVVNSRAREYALRHGRNENLFRLLGQAHSDRILHVDQFVPNNHAANPLEPLSLVEWSRFGSRSRYSLGRAIDFFAGGNSSQFCRSGWSQSEAWGCWTDGPAACLSIALDGRPVAETVLTVDARGFIYAGNQTLRVGIHANGLDLGTWRVSGIRQEYHVAIPPSAWQPFGILDVTFSIEDPRSPRELGLSEDDRRLGLAVSTVSIS
jgi:hypothetical protein